MSQNFPQRAINLAYFTENNKKCESKLSTSNYVIMVDLGMGNKILRQILLKM